MVRPGVPGPRLSMAIAVTGHISVAVEHGIDPLTVLPDVRAALGSV